MRNLIKTVHVFLTFLGMTSNANTWLFCISIVQTLNSPEKVDSGPMIFSTTKFGGGVSFTSTGEMLVLLLFPLSISFTYKLNSVNPTVPYINKL